MKLNLGCYGRKIHGFVNVDIREDVNPDVIDDIFKLKKFEEESADLIYVCHALEHANIKDSKIALKKWHQILKKGGTLRISVPDMEAHFAHYFYYRDLEALNSALWGSQRHLYDYHLNGWDFAKLKKDLESAGFNNIRKYDWQETEHFHVDDYSQAYVPHMDKINGKLMSLNVEATK